MTALVVIDQNVEDFAILIAGLDPDQEVLLLNTEEDGLEQIARYLVGKSGYDAIHILSHGEPGAVHLGSAVVNKVSLPSYDAQLQAIGEALTETADILLYGCDVAVGNEAERFIAKLAEITGADVAASNDLSGSMLLGGDWDLEIVTGPVEAAPLDLVSDYAYTLSTTETLNFSVNDASLWGASSGFSFNHTFDQLVFSLNPISTSGAPSADILGSTLGLDYALDVSGIEFGVPITVGLSSGVFDLSYPVDAQIGMPTQVKHGDTFSINTSPGVATKPTMSIDGPSVELSIDAIFKANISGHMGLTWDLPGSDPDAIAIFGSVDENNIFTNSSFEIDEKVGLYDLSLDSSDLDQEWYINGWVDSGEIVKSTQGSRVLYQSIFTIGSDIDLNGLDGAATVLVPEDGTLANFSVSLHQDDPMFYLEVDVDDFFGKWITGANPVLGEIISRLDNEYKQELSVLGIDVGSGYEAGALSLKLVAGVSPALKVDFDVEDIGITLTATTGEKTSGALGDSFAFEAPTSGAMSITSSYTLNGLVSVTPGLFFSVGYEAKFIGAEGQIFGLEIPKFFDDGQSGYLFNPSDDFYTKELFPSFLSYSYPVSFDLSGKNYAISWGDTTSETSVSTPGMPVALSVAVSGVDRLEQQGVYVVDEGNAGARDVTFTVARSGDLSSGTEANYNFTLGNGIDASDFVGGVPANGSLVFAAGESSKDITLSIIGDLAAEADERLTLHLTSSARVDTSATTLVIQSDDGLLITGSGEIFGTPRDDVILGSSQVDYIYAGLGNDMVVGGRGSMFGGSGNDQIDIRGAQYIYAGSFAAHLTKVTSQVDSGEGNDQVFVGGETSGNAVVDGGSGLDELTIDLSGTNNSNVYVRWDFDRNGSFDQDFALFESAVASGDPIRAYTGYLNNNYITSWVDISNFEGVHYRGGAVGDAFFGNDDFKVLSARGGGGTDTLYADWSSSTQDIIWNLRVANESEKTLVNGVVVQSIERVVLKTGLGDDQLVLRSESGQVETGAGDDVIDIRGAQYIYAGSFAAHLTKVTSQIDSGEGNDQVFVGGETSGNAVVDGGSGLDELTIDLSGTNNSNVYVRWDFDRNGSFDQDFALFESAVASGDPIRAYTGYLNNNYITSWVDISNFEGVHYRGGAVGDAFFGNDDFKVLSARGGGGTDTLYADWSSSTQDIIWNLRVANESEKTLVNGVVVQSIERVVLKTGLGDDQLVLRSESGQVETGAGDDVIDIRGAQYIYAGSFAAHLTKVTSQIDSGEGNDQVFVGGETSGNAVVDGGSGLDELTIDLSGTNNSNVYVRWDFDRNGSFDQDFALFESAVASGDPIRAYTGYLNNNYITSWVDISNFEGVHYRGGAVGDAFFGNDDFKVLSARGGGGTDTLYADWSSSTQDIIWNLRVANESEKTLVNGVVVQSIERVVLKTGLGDDQLVLRSESGQVETGAGDDVIDIRGAQYIYAGSFAAHLTKVTSQIDSGEGNDQVFVGGETSGNAVVDGGSGLDELTIDLSGTNNSNVYVRWDFDRNGSFDQDFALFESAVASGDPIRAYTGYLNNNYITSWVDISNFEGVHYRGGAVGDAFFGNGDFKVLSARGGGGTDTLYADWSSSTQDIIWNLRVANESEKTLVNGVVVQSIERVVLRTGLGDDQLVLSAQDDIISAGAGNDLIISGGGEDVISGGAGSDLFIDTPGGLNGDSIEDFSHEDAISVWGVRFSGLIYEETSGLLKLDTDGNGSYETSLWLPTQLNQAGFRIQESTADQDAYTQIWFVGDTDGDGIPDDEDNAVFVPNADQRDTDGDGYANIIDADLNQDMVVDFFDLSMLDGTFFTSDANADFNGDGIVDFFDLSLMDGMFGQAPGPSYVDGGYGLPPVAEDLFAAAEAQMAQLSGEAQAVI